MQLRGAFLFWHFITLKASGCLIKLHHISKIYRSANVETVAINDLNLKIRQGEFVSVMGPSGCGKTTLLNVIGLLDSFEQGLYVFDGKDVSQYSEKQASKLRKANIGFVFQNFNLIDELSVYENVELPLVYQGVRSAEREERVMRILNEISLAHRKDHYPGQLSGGQQQRVAVGRAVITQPKLILADEPTGNLDSKHGNDIMEMLSRLNDEGTTIVMVTHSEHDASYSHRLVKLLDGQIVSEKNILHV